MLHINRVIEGLGYFFVNLRNPIALVNIIKICFCLVQCSVRSGIQTSKVHGEEKKVAEKVQQSFLKI